MNAGLQSPPFLLSEHAHTRMGARSISSVNLAKVLCYGRLAHVRKARIFVIGRREVARWRREGVDLSDLEGIHVVCACDHDTVITVYRNRDLRGVRPRRRRCRSRSRRGRR
jgi:hypothetical protein